MPVRCFVLFHHNQCDHFQRFFGAVLHAVALTETGDTNITGVNHNLFTVVVEDAFTLDDVVELRFMMMLMIAEGTTGIDHNVGKHTAMVIHTGLIRQILDVNDTLAVLDTGISAVAFFRRGYHRSRITAEEAAEAERKRKEARREQGRAQTFEELVAIGKAKGYRNPSYWAAQVMRGRKRR